MDSFSLYFVSLAVIGISFLLTLRFINERYSNRSNLPLGTSGFPVVGETLQFFSSGPEKFIRQRMKKYSQEVFATSLLGQNVAVICGAAGNKFLLYTANHLVLPWLPKTASKFLNWVETPGQSSVRDVYAKSRHFLAEILKPESLKNYIPIMDSIVRQHLKTDWEPFELVKVYPLSQKYALLLACRLLLGIEDPKEVERISNCFSLTMQGMLSMPINLPGTPYNRALKEIKKLKQEFLRIIQERKKMVLENGEKSGSDILSRMLLDKDAHLRSDLEIAFHLLSLMLPSYEGPGSSITFVLKYLAELPHIYDMVYNEHMEIAKSKAPEELLNWEDIKKMKYSWNVICEAMRLTPPAIGSFREVQDDMSFAGFTIPKGWKILWSSFTTNKNPKYFADPETFDPTRFEGDGPVPCSFVPFSAGPRLCPGKEYSKFLILVYMYNVVRKFKLQNFIQDEKILYRAGPVPSKGLPMRLQPHAK